MIYCPHCGEKNSKRAARCSNCEINFDEEMKQIEQLKQAGLIPASFPSKINPFWKKDKLQLKNRGLMINDLKEDEDLLMITNIHPDTAKLGNVEHKNWNVGLTTHRVMFQPFVSKEYYKPFVVDLLEIHTDTIGGKIHRSNRIVTFVAGGNRFSVYDNAAWTFEKLLKKHATLKFEEMQREKGLKKFVTDDGQEKWGTPQQIGKWEKLQQKFYADLDNKNFDDELISFVKKYEGPWKSKWNKTKNKFISLLRNKYGECVSKKTLADKAPEFWKEILETFRRKKKKKVKKAREKVERDIKNKDFPRKALLVVLATKGSWEKQNATAQQNFINMLEKHYHSKTTEALAKKTWNAIRKISDDKKIEMVQEKIDLAEEIKKLGCKDVETRKWAATYLGVSQDKRAIRPLLEALKDKEDDVIISAVEALGNIGEPKVIGDIKKARNKIQRRVTKIKKETNASLNNFTREYMRQFGSEVPEDFVMEGGITFGQMKKGNEEAFKQLDELLQYIDDTISKLKQIKFERMAQVTEHNLREMDWQDFQDRVIEEYNGTPSEQKVADMGIDGLTDKGEPIQVKQSDSVGRNVVDNFETALRRYYPSDKKVKKGIIVAFSFSKGAYDEIHRAMVEDNIKIDLVTAEELVGE